MDTKTTFKLGFDADLQGLKRTNQEIETLKKSFDRLTASVGKTSGQAATLDKNVHRAAQAKPGPASVKQVPPIKTPLQKLGTKRGLAIAGRLSPGAANIVRSGIAMGGASMVGGLGIGAVGAALGLMIAQLPRAIKESKDFNVVLDGLYKRFHLSRDAQADFNATLKTTAHSLGMNRLELAAVEKSYLSLAGAIQGAARMQNQVKTAGGLARGMGLDPGQTITQFGGLAQSGAFGKLAGDGGLNVRDFATILADAVSRGDMKGREGELIQSIQSLVGVQLQSLTRPQNVGAMVGTMTALNQSNEPGLKGARGAELLKQLSQGIRNPGGGKFGEYVSYKAMGGGDYFKFKKRQEEGAFGESNNLDAMLKFYKRSFRDPNARHYAMGKHLGISMHQSESIEKAFSNMKMNGRDRAGFVDRLRQAAGGGQKGADKLERLDFAKLPILADLSRSQGPEHIKSILSDERIGFDRSKVDEILKSANPRQMAMQEIIQANLKLTESESLQKELAKLSDVMTNIGDRALPPVVRGLEGLNSSIDAVKEFFQPSKDENKKAVGILTGFGDAVAEGAEGSAKKVPKLPNPGKMSPKLFQAHDRQTGQNHPSPASNNQENRSDNIKFEPVINIFQDGKKKTYKPRPVNNGSTKVMAPGYYD